MIRNRFFGWSACVVAVLSLVSASQGALVQTNGSESDTVANDETSESNNNPVISPLFDSISSSDLLDNTVGSVATTAVAAYTADPLGGGFAYGLPEVVLTDGLQGIEQEGFNPFSGYPFDGSDKVWQITYNLDVTTNTLGYDLTEIGVYAAGPGNGSSSRGDIETIVSVDTGGGFAVLGTFQNFGLAGDRGGSKIILTDDTGTIATGVIALRFAFGGTALEPFYRELDAVGSPTAIPEPATITMLVFGAFCLAGQTRRKRNR